MNIIDRFKNQRLSAQIIEYNTNRNNDSKLMSRQAHCLSSLHKMSETVELWKKPEAKRAHYSGLQTCGSPWACPICAVKISEFRKDELEELINKAQAANKHIYMFTYTLPHYSHEKCDEVLGRFRVARQKMKAQRPLKKSPEFMPWVALKKYYRYHGSVVTLEVLLGSNGWHVHSHELFIFDKKIENQLQAREDFFQAWLKACDLTFKIADASDSVFRGFVKRSFKLDYLTGDAKKVVSEYMTKSGAVRNEKKVGDWKWQHEMTKSHLKKSEFESVTPFGMLDRIRETEDEEDAVLLKQKYFEYTQAFKGASFVRWSPGLRAKYDMEWKTDEEVAAGEKDILENWYGFYEKSEWKSYIRPFGLRGFVLEHSNLPWNELAQKVNDEIRKINECIRDVIRETKMG